MIICRLIKGFATEYVDLYAVITKITILKCLLGILSFLSSDLNKPRYCYVRERAGCDAETKELLLRLIHTREIGTREWCPHAHKCLRLVATVSILVKLLYLFQVCSR